MHNRRKRKNVVPSLHLQGKVRSGELTVVVWCGGTGGTPDKLWRVVEDVLNCLVVWNCLTRTFRYRLRGAPITGLNMGIPVADIYFTFTETVRQTLKVSQEVLMKHFSNIEHAKKISTPQHQVYTFLSEDIPYKSSLRNRT